MSDTVIIFLILAAVAGVFLVLFRRSRHVRLKVTGPGGIGLEVEASKDEPQGDGAAGGSSAPGGARIEGVKAGRDAVADDQTGQGAVVKDTEAGRDARATATPPGANPNPKP